MSIESMPELNNTDTTLSKPEIGGETESGSDNKNERGTRVTDKNIEKLHEHTEKRKDLIDDGWIKGTNDKGFQDRYMNYIKEENEKIEIEEENPNILIRDFKEEKSVRKKLAILERISEIDIINDEILDFVDSFSNNLIGEDKKIASEDGEYASFFEDGSENDDSVMRPFVAYLTEILEKTKDTEFQPRGEKILMGLLKNWNDFEVNYFYNFIGDLNDWNEKGQAEKSLVEAEYKTTHSDFGIDENVDNFDEGVKGLLNINTEFIRNKNKIINVIGEIGSRKSAEFLLEEIVKNKRSAHNNEIAAALLKIDPEYAKQELVKLAGDNDEIIKVNSIMILYRLQFGRLANDGHLEINKKDDLVCQKFHEIMEQIEFNRKKLENLFKNKKEISDEEIDNIVQNLISKAGQILVDFSDKIGSDDNKDRNDLMQKLEKYKADLILTASVFKGINKENINFEDLEGVEFEKKKADDLSDGEIGQMKDIYARNYEYNPKFQKAILENFDNILKESGGKTEVYFYKDNGKVVAFNRFDIMSKGRKYFGSFNVDPVLSSSSIGSSLMETSLEKEAASNEIEADCIPETPISSKYIGRCGFVVKKIDPDYKNTGVALFNIERKEDNKKYRYFSYSDKEIIEEYNNKNPDNQFSSGANQFILKFNPKSKELVETVRKLTEKDYVMSNYVFSENHKGAYCAFEKI